MGMVESRLQRSFILNHYGQGMIEYLLLLVITISMILLAMANLFTPMQNFLQNYMGTYVGCLLSSGELPAIRTENELKNGEQKCSFSITGGNAAIGNGGGVNGSKNGGSDGQGNGSSSAAESKAKSKNAKTGNGKDSKENGGNASGAAYAGVASRSSGFGKSAFNRGNSDNGGDQGGDEKTRGKRYINKLNKNGKDRYFKGSGNQAITNTRYGRGIAIYALTENDVVSVEKSINQGPRAVAKMGEEFSTLPKKSILKPPPPKKENFVQSKDEEFTFGNYLKYIIIAVIILLVIILGGGQVFEMSKTMD